MNNKKGEIPVVILVIGVLAICILAIVSFSVSLLKINDTFFGLQSMNKMEVNIEKYNLYKNLGMNLEEIKSFLDVFYIDESNNKYLFVETKTVAFGKDKIVFSVKYFLPS